MEPIDVITLGVAVMDIVARPADRTLFEYDNSCVEDITLAAGGDASNQTAETTRRKNWRGVRIQI